MRSIFITIYAYVFTGRNAEPIYFPRNIILILRMCFQIVSNINEHYLAFELGIQLQIANIFLFCADQ